MSRCWTIDDDPVHIWTLRRRGEVVTAFVRLLPVGLELQFRWNGEEHVALTFRDQASLERAATEKRHELEAAGWAFVGGGREPAGGRLC